MAIAIKRCSVLLLGFCVLFSTGIFQASSSCAWEGKVVGVTDGAFITVMHDGKGERIKLYGIDCPEKRQSFGEQAKEFTSAIVLKKVVQVEAVTTDRKGHTKDQYGRTLALVTTDRRQDPNEPPAATSQELKAKSQSFRTCLNEELIRSGLAWVYDQQCVNAQCREWKNLEKRAKRQKLGLWSLPNPIPPWEFRHNKEAPIPIYHGDIVKHVFHSSNCEEFDCRSCIAVFKGREQATKAGYQPCAVCNP